MTIRELLSRDHGRLDALLERMLRDDGTVDENAYAEFRRGLLRHIGIEERVLFPALKKQGRLTVLEEQLHRDHAALAALLVPPPAKQEIVTIRDILASHNPLEESRGGMYDRVDALPDHEAILDAARSYADVAVAPHSDTPLLRETIERLLRARMTNVIPR